MRLSVIVKTIAINILPNWQFKTSIKSMNNINQDQYKRKCWICKIDGFQKNTKPRVYSFIPTVWFFFFFLILIFYYINQIIIFPSILPGYLWDFKYFAFKLEVNCQNIN